jgi:hypothetical protein
MIEIADNDTLRTAGMREFIVTEINADMRNGFPVDLKKYKIPFL